MISQLCYILPLVVIVTVVVVVAGGQRGEVCYNL
jgi:hypothetical protein